MNDSAQPLARGHSSMSEPTPLHAKVALGHCFSTKTILALTAPPLMSVSNLEMTHTRCAIFRRISWGGWNWQMTVPSSTRLASDLSSVSEAFMHFVEMSSMIASEGVLFGLARRLSFFYVSFFCVSPRPYTRPSWTVSSHRKLRSNFNDVAWAHLHSLECEEAAVLQLSSARTEQSSLVVLLVRLHMFTVVSRCVPDSTSDAHEISPCEGE